MQGRRFQANTVGRRDIKRNPPSTSSRPQPQPYFNFGSGRHFAAAAQSSALQRLWREQVRHLKLLLVGVKHAICCLVARTMFGSPYLPRSTFMHFTNSSPSVCSPSAHFRQSVTITGFECCGKNWERAVGWIKQQF